MKALADENFPRAAVQELRRRGWDIVVVQDWRPATDDLAVRSKSQEEGRILLTFDKDFGQLWPSDETAYSDGIVLFRLPRLSALETINRIVDVLTSEVDWSRGFWVVEADRVRARKTSTP